MIDPKLTPIIDQLLHGFEESELCRRDACCGRIEIKPTDNCSCHISPPCSGCVEAPFWCPDCGWEAGDDDDQ